MSCHASIGMGVMAVLNGLGWTVHQFLHPAMGHPTANSDTVAAGVMITPHGTHSDLQLPMIRKNLPVDNGAI